MEKLYYSISEVSDILEEPVSKVRFWSDRFPRLVQPKRTAKGNRQYTEKDIESLKQIKLLSAKGLTLDGVSRQLSRNGSSADKTVKAIECLKEIRARLAEIKDNL